MSATLTNGTRLRATLSTAPPARFPAPDPWMYSVALMVQMAEQIASLERYIDRIGVQVMDLDDEYHGRQGCKLCELGVTNHASCSFTTPAEQVGEEGMLDYLALER